jgi:hypothetical protein
MCIQRLVLSGRIWVQLISEAAVQSNPHQTCNRVNRRQPGHRNIIPHLADIMNHRLLLSTLCVLFLLAANLFADENRFALVIGNGNYEEGRLKNPANDAKLISKSLMDLGFNVETKTDLDQQEMEETISSFSRGLPKNSFAFFFFAGHGIQAKKANYLIPVGATLNSESSLKYRTVPLDFVRDELENSKSNLNVVVLDCCRNNPFERSWNRSLGQRGFAPLSPVPEGTVIAFATGDGKTAADGAGENSPYTRELAAALSSRPPQGLSLVEGVFFTLGRTLKPKTKQHPHLYVDSTMPKYFLWKPDSDAAQAAEASGRPPATNSSKPKIAVTPPKSPKPKLASNQTDETSQEYEQAKLRLEQADRFHSEGHFDLAIEAYGALINDGQIPRELRAQSRRGRGGSYLAQGTRKGINLAIIDFQAAGDRGIQIPVMRAEADLKVEKDAKGKIRRNEIVLITKSRGDWLWVASAQGNHARQGWVSCSAFLSEPGVSATGGSSGITSAVVKPNVAEPNAVSTPQPVSASPSVSLGADLQSAPTKNPSIPIQAFGTDPLSTASSSGGQIVRLDSNGQIINPQSQMSTPQFSPSQHNATPPTASGQTVTFDANGRQIIQPSNSLGTRSLLPNQAQQNQSVPNQQRIANQPITSGQQRTFYTDQYGNPINQSSVPINQTNAPQQRSYTPSQQPQRQTYQQPQQQQQRYTQQPPQQYTQRQYTQQQNRNTQSYPSQFSNNGNMSLKDLNASRREFDREVSKYQWQNGPLSPAERREVNQWRQQNDRAKAKAFWGN